MAIDFSFVFCGYFSQLESCFLGHCGYLRIVWVKSILSVFTVQYSLFLKIYSDRRFPVGQFRNTG